MHSNFARVTTGALLVASTAVVGAITVNIFPGVPSANPKVGTPANVIADGYSLNLLATGTDPLENPSGIITKFGLLEDGTRTEPDENLYLVFDHNPGGPTEGFDYGRHFVFQGHENGGGNAYVTRVNLDVADPAHRITLLTPVDPTTKKTGFSSIDGSTWNPFTKTLLFAQEDGSTTGIIEIASEWPPKIRTLEGIIGKGGFEGIHPDKNGDIFIAEDAGGTSVNVVPTDPKSPKAAKQPNSFIYKFHPYDATDLGKGGQLYALQVIIHGAPVVFHAADPVGDTFSTAQLSLHTPGTSWPVQWALVHDTATDGFASFSANAAAKKALATPFKRPENLVFQPGSDFKTFFFCPTGDTNTDSGNQKALAARGAWGSIFRVDLPEHGPLGTIAISVLGDAVHNSFDNLAFADANTLMATEDRGDGLHDQLKTLDSVWAFHVGRLNPRPAPRRLIALGRDAVSAAVSEDNEPTGLYVSDGAATVDGLLGTTLVPESTRWFVTQQHGMNRVYEILYTKAPAATKK